MEAGAEHKVWLQTLTSAVTAEGGTVAYQTTASTACMRQHCTENLQYYKSRLNSLYKRVGNTKTIHIEISKICGFFFLFFFFSGRWGGWELTLTSCLCPADLSLLTAISSTAHSNTISAPLAPLIEGVLVGRGPHKALAGWTARTGLALEATTTFENTRDIQPWTQGSGKRFSLLRPD